MIRVLPCSAVSALVVLLTASSLDARQARRSGPAQVPVEVNVKGGAETFTTKGDGSCTHAPKASIYNVASEMWMVRHQDGERSVQLTLWKPADGSNAMFSVSLNGARSTTISTVRGGQPSGSGTVTMKPAAKGGTFTIDAKTKEGAAVTGTITCGAFTPAIAEGGN
jgi:hypothetical protein